MNYTQIKKYLSAARLIRYENVCNNDYQRVLKIYQTNLKLSQAFYPLLSLFEVVLRNALNEELAVHFANDSEWLKNQVSGFMSDPLLNQGRSNFFLRNSVNKIIRNNPGISHGKLITELTLGFWTELFEPIHYRILNGSPIHVFFNKPSTVNRSQINQKLINIRKFRNRVYHNEPIIFKIDQTGNTIISMDNARTVYSDLEDIFTWMGIDFTAWTRKINNVEFEIERADYIYSHYPKLNYYFLRIIIGFKLYNVRYLRKN